MPSLVRLHKPPRRMPKRSEILPLPRYGKIILLNGASSSGKSTLAAALQDALEEPFWHYSIDHLLAAKVLPRDRIDRGDFRWVDLRANFFAGFHASLPALAIAGNNLVVEHIVETEEWMSRLVKQLRGLDVYFVGVHCPLDELEVRERSRGDRRIGEARADFEITHRLCSYDMEVQSTLPADQTAEKIIAAWKSRPTQDWSERIASRQSAALYLPNREQ
jgi:chloramphenicol 3-O phosphotransferase